MIRNRSIEWKFPPSQQPNTQEGMPTIYQNSQRREINDPITSPLIPLVTLTYG